MIFLKLFNPYIAITISARIKIKPKRELWRKAPQLSFGFYTAKRCRIDLGAIGSKKFDFSKQYKILISSSA